jgi:hypothetical protein
MGERDGAIVDLLEAAKLAAIDAKGSEARAAKARLAARLRKVSVRGGQIRGLADEALAASGFLRELAWMTDPLESSRFDRQRQEFAIAMDRLIFELGVIDMTPASDSPSVKRPSPGTTLPERVARLTLASQLRRWLGGRAKPNEPAPVRKLRQRPGNDFNVLARTGDGHASPQKRRDPAAPST